MVSNSDVVSGTGRLLLMLFCCSLWVAPRLHARQVVLPHAATLAPAPAAHGTQDAPSAPDTSIRLDVVVTDGAGQPVSGLARQDFALTEDKHPQPILGFKAVVGDSDPEQAIVVLDAVNMGFDYVAQGRDQLAGFLRQHNGALPLPVSILLLNDTSLTSSGAPSVDGKALAADLDRAAAKLRLIRRSAGFYGDLERVDLSLRALNSLVTFEAAQPGRKLVIWISPGWPYLAYPGTTYSERDTRSDFALATQLSTEMRKARMTLYSADPRGTDDANSFQTTFYKTVLKGVRKQQDATLSALGLQVLAYQSGGLVLNSSNTLAPEIDACLRDATSYYELTIAATPAERDITYHDLSIKLDKPNLTARTRAGYYTVP